MLTKKFLLVGTAFLAVILFAASSHSSPADTQGTVAVAGQVTSAEEGPMEGVLVSAKKDGSTIRITVVSDKQGHYAFPAAKLEPGHYTLTIRAAGYDLDGVGAANVAGGKAATADLKLKKAKNLPGQLSNAEWIMSMPGTEDQKRSMLDCIACHTAQRIVKSTHDADEFVQVFDRMAGYYNGSTPLHPQRLVGGARNPQGHTPEMMARAKYFSSINLSEVSSWEYPLKTLPRPTGRATHVVITEYDLLRPDTQPHDVIVEPDGMVWYSDFGRQFLGSLDPKTGKVKEFPVPELKKGFPTGTLELEPDKDGTLWLSLMYQGGIARFDKKTETFKIYAVPQEWQADHTQESMVMPTSSQVDGKVWTNNQDTHNILRVDIATGKFEAFGPFKDPATGKAVNGYGIPADQENNLYLLDFGGEDIGRVDAKTGKFSVYKTPSPNSRPRRGRFDSQNRLWFAEYGANSIGMFDPKTTSFKEWKMPTAWTAPYDAVLDKNGEAWTASMLTDQVDRVDTKTGQTVEYLMPRETNVRRVFVDNSTSPVTFWVGNNHGNSIVKVEPTD